MAHHRHLVQRRLTIKDHFIAVDQVTLDDHTETQLKLVAVDVAQVYHVTALEDDRVGARVDFGTIAHSA
jgi:hypothetical protein